MALHTPILIQSAPSDPSQVVTAQEFRNYTRAALAIGDISASQGVISPGAYLVTQRAAGANLSVDVASGQAYVVGDDTTGQGTYHVWNDATVNVPGLTVPATGTFHHRLILQIEDRLNNAGWPVGTYIAALIPLLDTGGGLPAEPNSALTIATIDVPAGSPSVTNSMINDYRIQMGQLAVVKTGDTARNSTTALADDPDLQLYNFANSARYWVKAVIFYTGGGPPSSEGDIKYTWRVSSAGSGTYAVQQNNIATPEAFQHVISNWTDTNWAGTSGGAGGGPNEALVFEGMLLLPNRPTALAFQWGQNTSVGTNTTVKANSYIVARRMT